MLKWVFLFLPFALFSQANLEVVVFPQPDVPISLISQIAPQHDSIWVVSEGKIYCHNGYGFYPLQPDSVLLGYEAQSISPCDSGLWIGFYTHGLGFYHFKKRMLQWPFQAENGYPALPDQRIGHIFNQSDSGLWVQAHHHGLAFVSTKKPEIQSYPTQLFAASTSRGSHIAETFSLHPTKKNVRIVGTLGGVFLFDVNAKKYTRFYDLNNENCNNQEWYNGNENVVRSLFAKGDVAWIGTWGGGLIKLNLTTGKFDKFVYQPEKLAPNYFENFRNVHPINDSILSVMDVDLGVLYFNMKTERFQPIKNNRGQMQIRAYSFARGHQGDFYGGKNQLYLVPSQQSSFQKWTFPAGISAFKKDSKSQPDLVFVKDSNQTFIRHENATFALPFSRGMLINWHSISMQKVVAVSLRSVFFLNQKHAEELHLPWKEKSGIGGEIISSYFDENEQTIWLGTKSSGAFGYQLKTKTWLALNNGDFRRFWIKDIVKFNQHVCFVGEQQMHFYVPKDGAKKKVDFTDIEGLPKGFNPRQMLVVSPTEAYLLSTKNGFYRLHFESKITAEKCVLPKEVDVESFRKVASFNGHFFIATSNGLLHWSAKSGARLLGESYGLGIIQDVNFTNDTLWFLHQNELHFWPQPSVKALQKIYPKVVLTNFEVMGNAAQIDTEIHLDYHQNWLEWNAVPSSFLHPQMGKVMVKLEGFSEQWREVSAVQAYSISNLKPGKYTLVAKVKTRDNGFGPPHVLMRITIVPAWFQTWWFFAAIVLVILAILYALYSWRMAQLKQKQSVELQLQSLEMRMLRVQMNPYFIFNALNSVKYYILKENRTLASDYLSRFSKLLRFILSISKREEISLREELDALTNYIEFERIRFNHKFSFSISVDENINAIQTGIQPMLIQPFVENAIWHGLMPLEREGELSIKINALDDALKIEVKDNGVGREEGLRQKSKAHKSFGLNITTERLQALAKKTGKLAQYKITDLTKNGAPAGTLVEITLPYECINS